MINYKEILDLGFDRLEFEDSVFFEQNGYKDFVLTKTFIIGASEITFNWSQGVVKVYKNTKFIDIDFDNIHDFTNYFKIFQ